MKNSKIITAQEWRKGHPESLGFLPSDLYYARACTSLLSKINALFKKLEISSAGKADLALRLGHYIEDAVSRTHIFDSFRSIHQKMYGRKLPFYNLPPDYADDEVNIEDVKFLIWDHVQQIRGNEAIINPDNKGIEYIAESLFPLICDIYEEAPEVPQLHDFIYNPDNFKDFIDSKNVMLWLMLTCPLTASDDIWADVQDEMDALYENIPDDIPALQAFYIITSSKLFVSPCRWMALYAHEMLAQMLEAEGMKLEAAKIGSIRNTGLKNFTIIGEDPTSITLTDPDETNTYKVTKDSFGAPIDIERKYITTDLASFDGQTWQINGSCWFAPSEPEKPATVTDGPMAYEHYLKKLGGKRIGYFSSLQEMRKILFGGLKGKISDDIRSDFETAPSILVFLNSDGSLSVSTSLAATIPDPANPYFRGIDRALLLGSAMNKTLGSSEMARYFQEQGWYDGIGLSSSISPERGVELFEDNLDFLMRYFRDAEYRKS